MTKAIFQMRGVPTPAGKAMKKKDRVETPQELGMDFPVVVKTSLRWFQYRCLYC